MPLLLSLHDGIQSAHPTQQLDPCPLLLTSMLNSVLYSFNQCCSDICLHSTDSQDILLRLQGSNTIASKHTSLCKPQPPHLNSASYHDDVATAMKHHSLNLTMPFSGTPTAASATTISRHPCTSCCITHHPLAISATHSNSTFSKGPDNPYSSERNDNVAGGTQA